MQFLANILQLAVVDILNKEFNIEIKAEEIQIQETRKEFEGNLTVVLFPLLKQTKSNPDTLAKIIGEGLLSNPQYYKQYQSVKGFLNISFQDDYLMSLFKENNYPSNFTPKNIVLEYSSPNTNKPLHLGHIRNNLIGYSVAEILKAAGHKVTKVNLVNDRGIHICKSMLAWLKYGNGETPKMANLKGDHLVGKYYVLFDKYYKAEIQELTDKGLTKEEAEKQTPMMLEAQEMLRKWEQGDKETLQLWEMMNAWVYEGFEETYKKLGVDFDKMYYESQTYLLGKDLVKEGLEKNAFYKRQDNSVWIDLTSEGLDEKLVMRSDGTSVYITQDIGTANERYNQYHPDAMIYVVGNEQDYHFKVLKLIGKKLGLGWGEALYHLSYGMVDLPEGKMKSREGTVVDADDLIQEMIQSAKDASDASEKTASYTEEEKAKLHNQVAMAALKYFILKVDPQKRMVFNPKESIDLQGNTGPFIQYAYTRINSILKKSKELGISFSVNNLQTDILSKEERELVWLLLQNQDNLSKAANEYAPSVIANYAYELARAFNQFYQNNSVLNEANKDKMLFRLVLINQVAQVIQSNLSLLGISVPDRM